MTKQPTNWELIITIVENPTITINKLKELGFNEQTIRRYKQHYQNTKLSMVDRLKK
jgi:hypothetical protein